MIDTTDGEGIPRRWIPGVPLRLAGDVPIAEMDPTGSTCGGSYGSPDRPE